MTVTALSRLEARESSAPALRVPCPTCEAAAGTGCRHVSTGKALTGGVHPLRIRGDVRP